MAVLILKLIAMGTMVIDHTAFWFVDNNNVMRNIGRFAFVIYAFLIAESYYHLKGSPDKLKKHILKLLALCFITEIPYDLFDHTRWIDFTTQSVLPTLMLGFLALVVSGWWGERCEAGQIATSAGTLAIWIIAAMASYFIRSEYLFGGVILIGLFYLYLRKADILSIPWRLLTLWLIDIVYICAFVFAQADFHTGTELVEAATLFNRRLIGTLVAVVPIAFYNRKLGYNRKWFSVLYSIFYPLQFVALVVIRKLVLGF